MIDSLLFTALRGGEWAPRSLKKAQIGEQKESEEWMALKPKKLKIQLDMVCGGRASGFAGAVIVGVLNGYDVPYDTIVILSFYVSFVVITC